MRLRFQERIFSYFCLRRFCIFAVSLFSLFTDFIASLKESSFGCYFVFVGFCVQVPTAICYVFINLCFWVPNNLFYLFIDWPGPSWCAYAFRRVLCYESDESIVMSSSNLSDCFFKLSCFSHVYGFVLDQRWGLTAILITLLWFSFYLFISDSTILICSF